VVSKLSLCILGSFLAERIFSSASARRLFLDFPPKDITGRANRENHAEKQGANTNLDANFFCSV
jgi:hypothetical protein